MKNTRKKFALVISLVMAVSMAMTACSLGDDDDDDDDDSSSKKSISVSSDKDDDSSSDDESSKSGDDPSADDSSSEDTTTTTKAAEPEPLPEPAENTTTTQAAEPEVPDATTTTTKAIAIDLPATSGEEEEPVKNLLLAMETGKGEYFKKCLCKAMTDAVDQAYGNDYYDLFAQNMHDELAADYGENFKTTYTVVSKKEMSNDDIADFQDRLATNYGSSAKVEGGYILNVTATITYDGGTEDDNLDLSVGKVDGTWALLDLF